ncbi:hypothetical protein Rhow_007379 [Rhodococcus wratislaviensis]|uniref:Uncharacterized protein n=1 Tax=Rhodococcus wratislaviensis TaxID=44752 RepID=A0A402CI04_RHOWR|nr:hypothetical protein Rhow_007379 [Rhodococcus wratislaviensis]
MTVVIPLRNRCAPPGIPEHTIHDMQNAPVQGTRGVKGSHSARARAHHRYASPYLVLLRGPPDIPGLSITPLRERSPTVLGRT